MHSTTAVVQRPVSTLRRIHNLIGHLAFYSPFLWIVILTVSPVLGTMMSKDKNLCCQISAVFRSHVHGSGRGRGSLTWEHFTVGVLSHRVPRNKIALAKNASSGSVQLHREVPAGVRHKPTVAETAWATSKP